MTGVLSSCVLEKVAFLARYRFFGGDVAYYDNGGNFFAKIGVVDVFQRYMQLFFAEPEIERRGFAYTRRNFPVQIEIVYYIQQVAFFAFGVFKLYSEQVESAFVDKNYFFVAVDGDNALRYTGKHRREFCPLRFFACDIIAYAGVDVVYAAYKSV